jgi:glucose-1-phosphate thymidylyltransferase
MLAGIRDIRIISSKDHLDLFRSLLGEGHRLGLDISYAEQREPRGIAEAFLIGERYIGQDDVALILGDNVFHGPGFSFVLAQSVARLDGCELFGYPVKDAQRYGVGEIDSEGRLSRAGPSSRSWDADSPGSAWGPTTRCSRPAGTCNCSSSGRANASPASRR